jgi:glycine hydroxymethyltransferase
MTTRGFEEIETELVANLIGDVLDAPHDAATVARVREQVRALCRRFPVYPDAVHMGVPVEQAA